MVSPTAAFSVTIRVRLDNTPGTLGKLAAAIGGVGGNIVALEGLACGCKMLVADAGGLTEAVDRHAEVRDEAVSV